MNTLIDLIRQAVIAILTAQARRAIRKLERKLKKQRRKLQKHYPEDFNYGKASQNEYEKIEASVPEHSQSSTQEEPKA